MPSLRARLGLAARLVVPYASFATAGLLWLAGSEVRSPLVLKAKTALAVGVPLLALGLALLARRALLRRREAGSSRGQAALQLLTLLTAVCAMLAVPVAHLRHAQRKRDLLAQPRELQLRLGRHVIAGFRSWADAEELVRTLHVGGLYIGLHNARGLSAVELAAKIQALQVLKARTDGGELWIAADQEGGPVSRLSPPLPTRESLAKTTAREPAGEAQRAAARAFGAAQAEDLRALRVRINFAPVVDLKRHTERGLFDRYSFIGSRAIAADPDTTTALATAYAEGLISGGVLPTLKHFPGLGRVRTDTHFFPARIDTPLDELAATDFRPFAETLKQVPALLMVGHAYVTALDRRELASTSAKVVRGLVREGWQHDGVVITDDLCMLPSYYARGGIAGSALRALLADVDLLLVSYDGRQVVEVLAELHAAVRRGELAESQLASSEARLARTLSTVRGADRR